MRKPSRLLLGIASLCCTCGLWAGAAQAASDALQSLVQQARHEGSLTLYTVIPVPEDQRAIEVFSKLYPGISVRLIREGTGPLDDRYAAEARAGAVAADIVIQPSEAFVQQSAALKWSVALTPAAFPALKDWPASKVHGNYLEVMMVPWGIEYNTNLLHTPPSSYQDLAEPAYRGQLVFTSPLNGAPESVGWQYLSEQYGRGFLKRLAAQHPTFVASDVPAVQAVASGQYAAAVFSQPGLDRSLVANGAPVKFVLPSDTVAFAQYMMVSARAPHPAAARLFANFLLTRAGQEAFIGNNGISPLGDVSGAVPPPAHLKIGNITQAEKKAQENAELLGERP